MTISSISSLYSSPSYTQSNNQSGINISTSQSSADKKDSNAKTNASYATSSNLNSLALAVTQTLKGLGLSSGDRITFREIQAYRDQLTQEFQAQVKADLKKLGVSEDVNFQVVPDGDSGVKIISSHEDKAKIEKYFADNPDMVKKFQQIQGLTNVDAARKTQSIDIDAIRSRIQVESLTAWFAGSGQSINAIMNYANGSASIMSGLNTKV